MRRLLGTFVALASLVAALGTYVLWGSGISRRIEHRFEGGCRKVEGIAGAEDLTVHPETGIAYLTGIEPGSLGVYAYDLRSPDAVPVPVLPEGFEGLRPLGLSLWRGEPRDRLFVVNRRQPDPGVEIFRLATPWTLEHVRSMRDASIRYPNDVVAVGPDAFYVSNTHASPPGSRRRWVETFLRLPTGDVTYVDGSAARVVTAGLAYPNGVNVSRDLRELYVASTATSEVHVFARQPNGDLERSRSLPVPGLADNIDRRADGSLVVALHPKALDAVAHLGDPAKRAPTRIVHLDPRSPKGDAIRILYDDPGTEISAGATGVWWNDRLLIGPVREPFFLDCRLSEGV